MAAPIRGRGYATEAAGAMREHVQTHLGISRLVALIAPANGASIRVATKLGFGFEREITFHDRPTSLYAWEA